MQGKGTFYLSLLRHMFCLRKTDLGFGFGLSGEMVTSLFPQLSIMICKDTWELCYITLSSSFYVKCRHLPGKGLTKEEHL